MENNHPFWNINLGWKIPLMTYSMRDLTGEYLRVVNMQIKVGVPSVVFTTFRGP
jgi:hypothetical protein